MVSYVGKGVKLEVGVGKGVNCVCGGNVDKVDVVSNVGKGVTGNGGNVDGWRTTGWMELGG